MKMVILGAGASYDSLFEIFNTDLEEKWRPPLATQLFEPRPEFRQILLRYQGMKMLYSELNTVDDIEDYFQKKFNFATLNNSNEHFCALSGIQFALQDLMYHISHTYDPIGLSNYDILINHAFEYATHKKEDVLFVTFNYDLFLEYSLRRVYPDTGSLPFLNMNEYIKYPLKIIKLHGSCNWFKKFNQDFKPTSGGYHANYIFNKQFSQKQIENSLLEGWHTLSGAAKSADSPDYIGYYYPQLLIPFKSKDSFILPDAHLQCLEDNLQKIDSILVIGWKGQEQSFLNLLHEHLKDSKIKVFCVNAGNMEIETTMKAYIPNAKFTHFSSEFMVSKYNSRSSDIYAATFHSVSRGGFSSYILNVMKNTYSSFFD